MLKALTAIAAVMLSGCASTAAGLADSKVQQTFTSTKSAAVFATCVAENSPGVADLRSDGDRYWVIVSAGGVPRTRWDFTPTASGSIAELRHTALIGKQSAAAEKCL